MASNTSIPILLVTANVGSIFEDPTEMLKVWTEEFLSTISRLEPKFIALHCQEVGGKNYENSMKHVEYFVKLLMCSNELRLFDKVRVFLDEDYSSAENFTALGNLYFIHESINNVLLWDFKDLTFVPVQGKEIHSGNIEAVVTKEKAKFPQDFFHECKWSRKGFMRTRWSLNGTTFDLVNIHLFHDASNFIAMEQYPSVYCTNRRRALEHTLQRFHNDEYGKVPYFLFGDFNFRTDTESVIKKLTEGLTTTRLQNNKNNEHTKLQYVDNELQPILTVGKKEFNHTKHQSVFIDPSPIWLKPFDKELEAFDKYLTEYPINFPPSYPFKENISHATSYMQTRCPAWCDRVLLSHTAKKLIENDDKVEYGLIGFETCMGDHKDICSFLFLQKLLIKINIMMDVEQLKPVYDELKSLSVCDRCTIRLLNIKGDTLNYAKPLDYIEKFTVVKDEKPIKLQKINPCIVCCNLLTEAKLSEIIHMAAIDENLQKYKDYNEFNLLISFPKSIAIRNHAIILHLCDKFPQFYKKDINFLPLHRAFRFSIQERFITAIKRDAQKKSDLEITILLAYDDDEKEIHCVENLFLEKMGIMKRKQQQISRVLITDTLNDVSDDLFRKYVDCPPYIPSKEAYCSDILTKSHPIYIGGRYLKFSREMGQTPFIINNVKVVEHCLQDIIFDSVNKVMKFTNKLTFTASGREDADVRMLGTGRPFYIQIENPTIKELTRQQLLKIRKLVANTRLAYLTDLKMVMKGDLSLIKFGEESKSKTYVALCKFISFNNVDTIIERINNYGAVTLHQLTPVRVSHRRALLTRTKMIYSMNAKRVDGHDDLFELKCCTQAGTYIKEFVHGDLGRTKPSLGSITECPVDIICLDVVDINLEWPV